MILEDLQKKKLITPPSWLIPNVAYLTVMGSQAYGVSDEKSDIDIGGFAIPRKEVLFPHSAGFVVGFGTKPPVFDQYQQPHVFDKETGKEYDISCYSIVKLFELARQGNPNIIDMIFTPTTCVLHTTSVGNIVRENRRLFLSKLCWPKYKGYAYSQAFKMQEHNSPGLKDLMKFEEDYSIDHTTTFEQASNFLFGIPCVHRTWHDTLPWAKVEEYYKLYKLMVEQGKRSEGIKVRGWDLKYGFHLIRLLNYIEQILITGDLDLQQNREQLKSIRRGEWSLEYIKNYFNDKERQLEEIYSKSTLRAQPDEEKLKGILLDCLESHYGKIEEVTKRNDESILALKSIDDILEKLKTRGIF